jgi:hypothetical protein
MRARPGSIDRDHARRARTALSALVIAGCAGCFSDRGLAVEIHVGDTGATSVELYIGKVPCSDGAPIACDEMITPPGGVALDGHIWFRDDLPPYTAEVKGRTATFQLRADKASPTRMVLIAVGLVPGDNRMQPVGSATLRDVEIPVDGARIATATLVPATTVVPGETIRDGDRVLVWNKETPPSSCVVVEHWSSGVVKRDFVVPFEDADCDDAEPECNHAAYRSDNPPEASPADCVTSSGSQACVLGSRGCVDGQGPGTGECMPHADPVCVPSSFCGCPAPDLDGTCVQDLVVGQGNLPRVVCTVPANQSAAGLEPCADMTSALLDLSAETGSAVCGPPAVRSLQLHGVGASYDFGGAIIGVSNPSPACTLQVTWKSGARTLLAARDHGYVKVPVAGRALLLPLILEFTPGCVGPFTCTLQDAAGDTLWSCAQ